VRDEREEAVGGVHELAVAPRLALDHAQGLRQDGVGRLDLGPML
jgi:hypothetical protein